MKTKNLIIILTLTIFIIPFLIIPSVQAQSINDGIKEYFDFSNYNETTKSFNSYTNSGTSLIVENTSLTEVTSSGAQIGTHRIVPNSTTPSNLNFSQFDLPNPYTQSWTIHLIYTASTSGSFGSHGTFFTMRDSNSPQRDFLIGTRGNDGTGTNGLRYFFRFNEVLTDTKTLPGQAGGIKTIIWNATNETLSTYRNGIKLEDWEVDIGAIPTNFNEAFFTLRDITGGLRGLDQLIFYDRALTENVALALYNNGQGVQTENFIFETEFQNDFPQINFGQSNYLPQSIQTSFNTIVNFRLSNYYEVFDEDELELTFNDIPNGQQITLIPFQTTTNTSQYRYISDDFEVTFIGGEEGLIQFIANNRNMIIPYNIGQINTIDEFGESLLTSTGTKYIEIIEQTPINLEPVINNFLGGTNDIFFVLSNQLKTQLVNGGVNSQSIFTRPTISSNYPYLFSISPISFYVELKDPNGKINYLYNGDTYQSSLFTFKHDFDQIEVLSLYDGVSSINTNYTFDIISRNSYGELSYGESLTGAFNDISLILIGSNLSSPVTPSEPQNGSTGFITQTSNLFGIFPDANTMSNTQKITVYFAVNILLGLLVLLLALGSGLYRAMSIAYLFLLSVSTLLFIAIGYIPAYIIIIASILSAGFVILFLGNKFKGGD